jgi:hypothetical protein
VFLLRKGGMSEGPKRVLTGEGVSAADLDHAAGRA